MKATLVKPVRCAIYTRVSTEHGLDQEFNSLGARPDKFCDGHLLQGSRLKRRLRW